MGHNQYQFYVVLAFCCIYYCGLLVSAPLINRATKYLIKKVNYLKPDDQKEFVCKMSIWYYAIYSIKFLICSEGVVVPVVFLPGIDQNKIVGIFLLMMILPCVFFSQFFCNTKSFISIKTGCVWFKYSLFSDSMNNKIEFSDISSVEFTKQFFLIDIKDGYPIKIPRDVIFAFKGYNKVLNILYTFGGKGDCSDESPR